MTLRSFNQHKCLPCDRSNFSSWRYFSVKHKVSVHTKIILEIIERVIIYVITNIKKDMVNSAANIFKKRFENSELKGSVQVN